MTKLFVVFAVLLLAVAAFGCNVEISSGDVEDTSFGDARDSIVSIPDADQMSRVWSPAGLSRDLFANPSLMSEQDIRSLVRAGRARIASLWHEIPTEIVIDESTHTTITDLGNGRISREFVSTHGDIQHVFVEIAETVFHQEQE